MKNVQLNEETISLFEYYGYSEECLNSLMNHCEEHDPKLLHDYQKAIDMIHDFKANDDKVAIIGDYDGDGITATSIMIEVFRSLDIKHCVIIPNRFEDGYGLSTDLLEKARKKKCTAIITVDNGIVAFDAVEVAKGYGMKVIITDHHNPKMENDNLVIPNADAVVNPKISDDYPFKDISGATVAYKIAQAFLVKGSEELDACLQLAAISVVSDAMPLGSKDPEENMLNENRGILERGLESINQRCFANLQCLLKACKIKPEEVDEKTIAFYVAPLLNACGRISGSAEEMVEQLTTERINLANSFAGYAKTCNEKRKVFKAQAMEEVLPLAENDMNSILIYKTNCPEGVVGIVAGQLADKFKKPTIILTSDEQGFLKGSARSVDGVSVYDILSNCNQDYFIKWGGHDGAAGLSIKPEYYDDFVKYLHSFEFTHQETRSKVYTIKQDDVYKLQLKALKPFGQGFECPKVESTVGVNCFWRYYKNGYHWLSNDNEKIWAFDDFEKLVNALKGFFMVKSNINDLQSEDGMDYEEAYSQHYEFWKSNSLMKLKCILELDYDQINMNIKKSFKAVTE